MSCGLFRSSRCRNARQDTREHILLGEMGLPLITANLRHTFGSLLLQNGASIVYVKEQMGHSSIQVTVDTHGHLIPDANACFVDRLDGSAPRRRKQVRTNPQLPRNQGRCKSRRTSCKLLKRLVAAVGLEPTTYGL
jgi:hypothetical protein